MRPGPGAAAGSLGGVDPSAGLSLSPLDGVHRAAGARMVAFGGWEMPLSYPSGTIAEHMACRQGAALFDVSHLGTLEVSGPGAFGLIQAALSNDLGRIGPGRAQYTHLLCEDDASVLDDIIVWWLEHECFWVMPNASNNEAVLGALQGCRDVAEDRALLALQGPLAREVLAAVAPEAAGVGRFAVAGFEWQGAAAAVAGTGYTGEDGVEISAPAHTAAGLWEALVAAGSTVAGLGARDTLRLEAGLPLHGHELGPGITPLDAGLGWSVGWDKPAFRGREALLAAREAGPRLRLRGLLVEGRRPPREGQAVLYKGEEVATVTSGNFSPVLGQGIAMSFLPVEIADGSDVVVSQRSGTAAATVTGLPFV